MVAVVGVIATYIDGVIFAIGEDKNHAQSIAFDLLQEAGLATINGQFEMVFFDPGAPGGVRLEAQKDEGIWTDEGWNPS